MSKPIERRIAAASIEIRTNTDGTVGLSGYAAVFDSPAHGEVVKRSAFNRTLAQRDNARLLVNHDGVPLASVKAGTMTLTTDERGLLIDVPSLDMANPTVQELVSAMARGDVDQMSFAFTASDDPVISGVRELREVRLYDVSVVTFPWYEDTTVALTGNRKADKALVSVRSSMPAVERRTLIHSALRAAPPGLTSYGDLACQVCDAVTDMLSVGGRYVWAYLDDLGPDWAVYSVFDGDDWDYYQIAYTAEGDVITLGVPFEVEIVTEYRPMTTAEIAADDAERQMANLAEARMLLGFDTAA